MSEAARLELHLQRNARQADMQMQQRLTAARGVAIGTETGEARRARLTRAMPLTEYDLINPYMNIPHATFLPQTHPYNIAQHHQHHGASIFRCNTCGKTPSSKDTNYYSSSSNNDASKHLARCSGCRAVYCIIFGFDIPDCSKSCQRNDWLKHKFLCRHVRTMDTYQLAFLKISSTIPGNYHRPVLSKSPSIRSSATLANATTANSSTSPPNTDDGVGVNIHNHAAASSSSPSNNPSSIPLPPPATSSSSSSSVPVSAAATAASTATPAAELPPSGRVRSKRARHSKVVIDSSSGVPTATLAVFEFPNNTSSSQNASNSAANKSATPVGSPPATEMPMDAELLPVGRAEEQEGGSSSDSSSSSSDDDENGLEKRLSSEHRSGKKRKQPSSSSSSSSAGPPPAAVRSLNISSAAAMDTSSSSAATQSREEGPPSNGNHDAIVPLAIQPLVLDVPFSPDNPQPLPPLPSEEKLYKAYGRRPVYGNQCLLMYQGRMSDGSVFTKNRDVFFNSNAAATPTAASLSVNTMKWIKELNGATPLHFTLGIGEVLLAWDACVATMFKGERATIITRDENRQVFIYELQLVDFE